MGKWHYVPSRETEKDIIPVCFVFETQSQWLCGSSKECTWTDYAGRQCPWARGKCTTARSPEVLVDSQYQSWDFSKDACAWVGVSPAWCLCGEKPKEHRIRACYQYSCSKFRLFLPLHLAVVSMQQSQQSKVESVISVLQWGLWHLMEVTCSRCWERQAAELAWQPSFLYQTLPNTDLHKGSPEHGSTSSIRVPAEGCETLWSFSSPRVVIT